MTIKSLPFSLAAFLFSSVLLSAPLRAGESLIPNGDFSGGMEGWSLIRLEGAVAEATTETGEQGKKAAHVKVPQAAAKRYYVQLVCKGVKLHEDKTYHLKFRARIKPAGEIVFLAASYHGKFEELFRQDHIAVTEEWADYTCDFKPKYAEDSAQLIFSGLGAQAGDFWLTDVSMTEGD